MPSKKERLSMLKASESKHLKFEDMSMFPGNSREEFIQTNDAERIDASVASESSKIYASQKLAKFFEIDVTLKIFGHVIWSWHFPPDSK